MTFSRARACTGRGPKGQRLEPGREGEWECFCLAAHGQPVAALTHHVGDPKLGRQLAPEALVRAWTNWERVRTPGLPSPIDILVCPRTRRPAGPFDRSRRLSHLYAAVIVEESWVESPWRCAAFADESTN